MFLLRELTEFQVLRYLELFRFERYDLSDPFSCFDIEKLFLIQLSTALKMILKSETSDMVNLRQTREIQFQSRSSPSVGRPTMTKHRVIFPLNKLGSLLQFLVYRSDFSPSFLLQSNCPLLHSIIVLLFYYSMHTCIFVICILRITYILIL